MLALLYDAVVIGGGIAGLAAAWALRDLDVVVLEAADRPGGRIRSERRGRYWLNFGAHVVAGEGTATDALLRETDVEALPVPGVLTAVELHGRVVAGGRVESYPLRLPLRPRDRLALVRTGLRLRLGVLAYDRMLRTADQRGVLAYRGDESFTDWLGRVPEDVDAILRPTLERSSGEPEHLSAGYGIGYFHLAWDRGGGLARAILGGPATLPETVAATLGERLRLRTPVHEVAVDGDAVRVVHEDGELTARTAVVATPAHATQAIVRTLPDETRHALERIAYGPYVVAAFLTDETSPQAWDGIYALAAARRSYNLFFNSANVLRPREARREPGGSLQVYAAADLARRLADTDDADAARMFLDDLDEAFPGIGNVVAETVVHRWERGLPYVAPGRHRLQAALERPLDPLYLAGDYLGSRYTETAIHTGTAAAAAVRARLTAQAS